MCQSMLYEHLLLISDINECSSSPCQNGGSCVDGVNKYTCKCAAGYGGTHCQTGELFDYLQV